jgi:hypothetical protein
MNDTIEVIELRTKFIPFANRVLYDQAWFVFLLLIVGGYFYIQDILNSYTSIALLSFTAFLSINAYRKNVKVLGFVGVDMTRSVVHIKIFQYNELILDREYLLDTVNFYCEEIVSLNGGHYRIICKSKSTGLSIFRQESNSMWKNVCIKDFYKKLRKCGYAKDKIRVSPYIFW